MQLICLYLNAIALLQLLGEYLDSTPKQIKLSEPTWTEFFGEIARRYTNAMSNLSCTTQLCDAFSDALLGFQVQAIRSVFTGFCFR